MNQDKVLSQGISIVPVSFELKIYFWTKRFFDVLVSIIGMISLLPLALVIKVLYLCTGDFHSIFFKQERIDRKSVV